MRIAILTSGILPIPAVMGGAVENLTDCYLRYNDRHRLHDITVYSIAHEATATHPALQSQVNHYCYIDMDSRLAMLKKQLYKLLHRQHNYYYYTIEYYFHQAVKLISRQHYDAIIVENRPGFGPRLKQFTGIPIIYHIHNNELHPQTPMAREIYDAATRIVCVSDYIASRVKAITTGDTKCVTVHNGIDLTRFRPDAKPIDRNRLGLGADDFVVLYSGHLIQEKGVFQLADAMALLSDYKQIKLVVVGGSTFNNKDNNTDHFIILKEKLDRISDKVVITGAIPYSQMPAYLKLADVVAAPSVCDEAFGLTVAEAQALGLPIITTCRGGIPEVVTKDNAILLTTDEHLTDSIAGAILGLYQHPDRRMAMAEASLSRSTLFSSEQFAQRFFEALLA